MDIIGLLFAAAKRAEPLTASYGPSYRSAESDRSDAARPHMALLGHHLVPHYVDRYLTDFCQRRLVRSPWSGDQTLNFARLLRLLAVRQTEIALPVLIYDFGVRHMGAERKAIPFKFEDRHEDMMPVTGDGGLGRKEGDQVNLAAIRHLLRWDVPNTDSDLIAFGSTNAGIRDADVDFKESRWYVGYADVSDSTHVANLRSGYFPAQQKAGAITRTSTGIVVEQPFFTFAIVDPPAAELPLAEASATAYTFHVNPENGKVSGIIIYETLAGPRLLSMPDVLDAVQVLFAKLKSA